MPGEVKVEQRHKDEAVTLANRLNLTADQFTSGIADVFARSFAQFEARLSHSATPSVDGEAVERLLSFARGGPMTWRREGAGGAATDYNALRAVILASLSPRPLPTREEVARVVDPDAWDQRARHLAKAGKSDRRSEALGWLRRADDVVTASLRTTDAILALLSREAQS